MSTRLGMNKTLLEALEEYSQMTRKEGTRNKKNIIKLARLKVIVNVCYVLPCSTASRGVNRTPG